MIPPLGYFVSVEIAGIVELSEGGIIMPTGWTSKEQLIDQE